MKFKKMRGVKKPEEEQGLIFYTCLNYKKQPHHIKRKIDDLCITQGGDKAEALREWLITGCDATYVSQKHHWSESALYAARRRFFNSW